MELLFEEWSAAYHERITVGESVYTDFYKTFLGAIDSLKKHIFGYVYSPLVKVDGEIYEAKSVTFNSYEDMKKHVIALSNYGLVIVYSGGYSAPALEFYELNPNTFEPKLLDTPKRMNESFNLRYMYIPRKTLYKEG